MKKCKSILPSPHRLRNNEYKGIPLRGLVACMYKYPEVFKCLEQEKEYRILEDYKTLEEHRQLAKENNLINKRSFIKFIQKNNSIKENYSPIPWSLFKITVNKFFDREGYKTLEEHQQLAKDNDLFNQKQFEKFIQNNNLKKKGYYIQPWRPFGISSNSFFQKKYYSLEKHRRLSIDNNLINRRQYTPFVQKSGLRKKGYSPFPWHIFGISETEFFGRKKIIYKTLKQHQQLSKEKNLTTNKQFEKFIQDNDLIKQGYSSNPWRMFNCSGRKFFCKKKFKTLKEHRQLVADNDLTTCNQFTGYIQQNNLKQEGYSTNPWNLFKMTTYKFFNKEYKTLKEHQRFVGDNSLTDNVQYKKFIRDKQLKGYYIYPWNFFKMTVNEFFGKSKAS